jgi:Kef-type K+ transport system membrane component KefB
MNTSIEFQMSLLLFAALAGHLLAIGLRQPAVVGEILMGLVLGPTVLGWITYTDFIAGISQLGAIALLFVVGLEFKLKEILTTVNTLIALMGVIVSCIAGYSLASVFGFDSQRALLIGVALAATSIAITADVLRELGKLHTATAKVIIGAAVLGNVIALLALSYARQAALGDISLLQGSILAAKGLLFFAVAAILGQLVLARGIKYLDETKIASRYPQFLFIFAILVAFAYAMAAERAGLSVILGAFIAGISLEGIELHISRRFTEGADYLRILFGAVFFVSLGVLADLRAFTLDQLLFMLALSMVAVFSKLIGCGLPALWLGKRFNEAVVIGMGMVPRGEVAMVIALFALNDGLVQQTAYTAVILMSLLTMIVAPVIMKRWLSHHVT